MAFQFPWTNFHELNLDWFLSKFKQFTDNYLATTATAESVPYGTQPSVTVTGGELDDDTDIVDPFTFNFKIPAGEKGEKGDTGYPTDEQTEQAVAVWLNDHPEATTTVQDHSLSYEKLINGTLNFVTPEMYGAVGDGVTDDTTAIQSAIDTNQYVLFAKKTYKITEPILLENKTGTIINAESATIQYTGNDSAFVVRHVQNSNIYLGELRSPNGIGIKFDATQSNYWSQYINIYFRLIVCNSDCVYADIANQSWVNQINLMNGRLASNANGVHIYHNCTAPSDNWNFINVGFEGVVNAVFFENTMLQTYGYIHGMTFIGCRYEESFTKLIKSRGYVKEVTFIGSDVFASSYLDVDSNADNWTIYAPIAGNSFNKAYIKNGNFVNELATEQSAITPSSDFSTVGTNVIRKSGKVVTIRIDGKYNAGSGYISVGTLPAGYIPPSNVITARTINVGGTLAYLRINSNSRVEIYCPTITSGTPDFYIYETYLIN